jgi:hypothetical protein
MKAGLGNKERPVLDHVVTASSRAALEVIIDADFHFLALSITPVPYGSEDMPPLRWRTSNKKSTESVLFADALSFAVKNVKGMKRERKPDSGITLKRRRWPSGSIPINHISCRHR